MHLGSRVLPVIVTSTRFGSLDISEDRAIDFGPGILGFPDGQRYVLVEIEDDEDYFWIQSVEIDDVAFLCIRPWDFFPDYELDVPDDVQEQIELHDPADSEVFLLLTTHHEDDELVDITANLLGPIILNSSNRRARQVVLNNSEYSTRQPLVAG